MGRAIATLTLRGRAGFATLTPAALSNRYGSQLGGQQLEQQARGSRQAGSAGGRQAASSFELYGGWASRAVRIAHSRPAGRARARISELQPATAGPLPWLVDCGHSLAGRGAGRAAVEAGGGRRLTPGLLKRARVYICISPRRCAICPPRPLAAGLAGCCWLRGCKYGQTRSVFNFFARLASRTASKTANTYMGTPQLAAPGGAPKPGALRQLVREPSRGSRKQLVSS